MSGYQEHTSIPSFEPATWIDGRPRDASPGMVRWGGKTQPPSIGTAIRVTMNGIGPAIVTGYFVEHGWLGILCTLTDPPAWHRKQNKGNMKGHVFGPEFEIA